MTVATTLGKAMMRNFYRCYILPQHIAKAKEAGNTERHDSLAVELKRRTKEIVDADLKGAYAEYVKAQQAKQVEWDAYAEVKAKADAIEEASEALEVLGLKAKDLGPEINAVERAQAKMLKAREAFRAEYERF